MNGSIICQLDLKIADQGRIKVTIFIECTYGRPKLHKGETDQHSFKTNNVPCLNVSTVEDAVMNAISKICQEEDEYVWKGSSVTLTSIKRIQLQINMIDLLCASSYIALHAQNSAKEAIINPCNKDHQYFECAILMRYAEWQDHKCVNQ
ncbi:hypothetical protein PR048_020209 [Dryococelus australis]|uniref:Uncharacterized protein n=1 Tax=Dryococelus australis TaxID=614101 RepID=A0ABQ9H5M7_9NEOP|nr:hypothetical protein PR048_020209 [Dryococelus australis]